MLVRHLTRLRVTEVDHGLLLLLASGLQARRLLRTGLRILGLLRGAVLVTNATLLGRAWLQGKGLNKVRQIVPRNIHKLFAPFQRDHLRLLPHRGQVQLLQNLRCHRLQVCLRRCTRHVTYLIEDHRLQAWIKSRMCR